MEDKRLLGSRTVAVGIKDIAELHTRNVSKHTQLVPLQPARQRSCPAVFVFPFQEMALNRVVLAV